MATSRKVGSPWASTVWWIAFGATLPITVAASAVVWATPLASFVVPEGGILDPVISFLIFFGMSGVWFDLGLAEEVGMLGYLQPRLLSLDRMPPWWSLVSCLLPGTWP